MNKLFTMLLFSAVTFMWSVCQPTLGMASQSVNASRIEKETVSFISLVNEYRKADATERPALLAQLVERARARRLLLAAAADNDPASVLKVAIPAKVRNLLPAAARAEIEDHAELEGNMEMVAEDVEGRSSTSYYLTRDGRRFKVNFTAAPPQLLTGIKVKTRGVAIGNDSTESVLVVDPSISSNILILGDSSTPISSNGVPMPSNTFGEQRVLLFLVNFPGNQSQPWTVEQARALMAGVPNDFFRENSSGQTWLTVDVAGWFTIPVDVTSPSPSLISYYARQAAAAAGFDLSAYSRYVYAFPALGNSVIANQGTVGGTPSETWLNGTLSSSDIVIHELGHNFGLLHSHALDCGSQVYCQNGTVSEYGDVLDTMGGNNGHFTAFQKQTLGWLDYGYSPSVTHVASNGTYAISPYAAAGSETKALQIPQGIDPVSGKQVYFYVECRQAIGFDSWLTGSSYILATSGVTIHVGTDGDYRSSYLLDLTPQSQIVDLKDAALAVGKSYTDPISGVTITANSVSFSGASVTVSFSQPVCVAADPMLSLAPAQGPWVGAGVAVTFNVTVTNPDSSACSDATFNLSAALPAGWSGSFGQSSLTIPPGGNATTTFTVTSSSSAADGFYPVPITAVNASSPSHSATLSAVYVVDAASANHLPVAVSDSAATSVGTAVTVSVLANDSDPDGDTLSLASVTQPANGKTTVNRDGSVTYLPNKRFSGTDQFSYTVTDGEGGSASASVTVTVSSASTKPSRK